MEVSPVFSAFQATFDTPDQNWDFPLWGRFGDGIRGWTQGKVGGADVLGGAVQVVGFDLGHRCPGLVRHPHQITEKRGPVADERLAQSVWLYGHADGAEDMAEPPVSEAHGADLARGLVALLEPVHGVVWEGGNAVFPHFGMPGPDFGLASLKVDVSPDRGAALTDDFRPAETAEGHQDDGGEKGAVMLPEVVQQPAHILDGVRVGHDSRGLQFPHPGQVLDALPGNGAVLLGKPDHLQNCRPPVVEGLGRAPAGIQPRPDLGRGQVRNGTGELLGEAFETGPQLAVVGQAGALGDAPPLYVLQERFHHLWHRLGIQAARAGPLPMVEDFRQRGPEGVGALSIGAEGVEDVGAVAVVRGLGAVVAEPVQHPCVVFLVGDGEAAADVPALVQGCGLGLGELLGFAHGAETLAL